MLIKFNSSLITQPHTSPVLPHLPAPAVISHHLRRKSMGEIIIGTSVLIGGDMYLDGYKRSSLIPVSKLILTIRI